MHQIAFRKAARPSYKDLPVILLRVLLTSGIDLRSEDHALDACPNHLCYQLIIRVKSEHQSKTEKYYIGQQQGRSQCCPCRPDDAECFSYYEQDGQHSDTRQQKPEIAGVVRKQTQHSPYSYQI